MFAVHSRPPQSHQFHMASAHHPKDNLRSLAVNLTLLMLLFNPTFSPPKLTVASLFFSQIKSNLL